MEKEKQNYKEVQRVLGIILLANILVAGLKIIVGALINSASLTADGFHSVSDGASNVVGLIGIRFASKGADMDHPYGHSKYEAIAGLFITIMLVFAGLKVIVDAIGKFLNPVTPEVTLVSILALIFTLVVNVLVTTIEHKKGKELNSQILISDAMHTKSDIFISLGVLATLLALKFGMPVWIDPLTSLVVAGFILHAAYEVFQENSRILMDGQALDREEVLDFIMSFDKVKGIHQIRSRSDINKIYIDLHIQVNPQLSVEESHDLVHAIEDAIKAKYQEEIQLIAHVEPYKGK